MEDYARAEYPACMQRVKEQYLACMNSAYPYGCDMARQTNESSCSNNLTPSYGTCTSSYNACYTDCGGKVIKEQVCTKNCDG